jgi:hypothetical protein
MKKLYKTMKARPNAASEPRDLSREWHSDSKLPFYSLSIIVRRLTIHRPLRNLPIRLLLPPHARHSCLRRRYPLVLGLRAVSPPTLPTSILHPQLKRNVSYDRLSPSFRTYLESLTATCAQPVFKSACEAGNYPVMSPRGSPINVDFNFAPSHSVVRTHPVTGWKSVFAGVGLHVSRINDVYDYEDQMIREYLMRLITRNHDCVARMHWTRQACAIWSNVCTLHAATVSSLIQEGPGNIKRFADEGNSRIRISRMGSEWV